MMLFFISCAFVSKTDMNSRLDPDGDGFGVEDDCDNTSAAIGTRQVWYEDSDRDGYGAKEKQEGFCSDPGEGWSINNQDCDDTHPSIHPFAREICDGIDNNCDDEIDDAIGPDIGGEIFYLDADDDGVGTEDVQLEACVRPEEYAQDSGDCDDQNPFTNVGIAFLEEDSSLCMTDVDGDGFASVEAPIFGFSGTDCNDDSEQIHPFAEEVIADGVDQDCDLLDMCFYDIDGDGFGSISTILGLNPVSAEPSNPSLNFCDTAGRARNQADCDDMDVYTFPGAAWLDSQIQCMRDADQDGFGDTTPPSQGQAGSDCDDNNSIIHPNAYDVIADALDQNCDGADACYYDGDGDGFGVLSTYLEILGSSANTIDCSGDNESIHHNDCDDNDVLVHPMAEEIVGDEVDQNCDGTEQCYFDQDNDGFGTGNIVISTDISCSGTQETSISSPSDCDDDDSWTYPGAAFEDSATLCMRDEDGDGYGDMFSTSPIVSGTDCDDASDQIAPSAGEICDEIDNDCDAHIDDADPSLDSTSAEQWFADLDEDGYGDASNSILSCVLPTGFVDNPDDCDDGDVNVSPQTEWFLDDDGDGFGDPQINTTICIQPTGYVLSSNDCDDTTAQIHPSADEICDGIDNNCDALVDEEDSLLMGDMYYADLDFDGYGDASTSLVLCSAIAGFIRNSDDCNDEDILINPQATEVVGDGVDQNCNGEEVCFVDADGDLYPSTTTTVTTDTSCSGSGLATSARAEDCDDGDALIHPMAQEQAGMIDYNCDGFESLDSSCYSSDDGSTYFLFCTNAKEWGDARDNCEYMGYELTSIRTIAENTHVMDHVTERSWIGYRDTDSTRCSFFSENVLFEWTDGYEGMYQNNSSYCGGLDSVGYHNWDLGSTNAGSEPNNYNGKENCVEIYAEIGQYNHSIGTWNDDECGEEKAYICSIRE